MTQSAALTPFDAAAILIVLAAALGYVNHRFLRLPQSVGLTLMGAIASLAVIGLDRLLPGSTMAEDVLGFITGIDFQTTLMDGMLSFLLFAGALHVDWSAMQRGRWPILVLSTVGVLISTGLVGGGFYLLTHAVGIDLPMVWCLVFGALISPTDPVAVMSVLKRARVGSTLEATVAGESLFNDGVGVVVFSIVLATAISGEPFSLAHGMQLLLTEAIGGVLLGLATGYLAFRAMRSIDEYNVEVLISLAVVMGGYALAQQLHVSGPVAMAVAGLLLGNHAVAHAMSDTTRDYLLKFWALVDDILNAVLFLLIGLVVVTIPFDLRLIVVGLLAVPLVLAARAIAVMLPLTVMRPFLNLGPLAPPILIWGGLRGGISVALALGLPDGLSRSVELTATYIVVLFAVVVQGSSIARLVKWRQQRSATSTQDTVTTSRNAGPEAPTA